MDSVDLCGKQKAYEDVCVLFSISRQLFVCPTYDRIIGG